MPPDDLTDARQHRADVAAQLDAFDAWMQAGPMPELWARAYRYAEAADAADPGTAAVTLMLLHRLDLATQALAELPGQIQAGGLLGLLKGGR